MVYNCLIGNINNNEIEYKACEPVSKDVCYSGYMAPADKISVPEGLENGICCKCKSTQDCSYCLDNKNCTGNDDKDVKNTDKFITTNLKCFSDSTHIVETNNASDSEIDKQASEQLQNVTEERSEEEKDFHDDLRYSSVDVSSVDIEKDDIFSINFGYIYCFIGIIAIGILVFQFIKQKKMSGYINGKNIRI
tara:strand:+ start:999 stop:1574 length:576 start_codon:yes stop_codon:yes gene_type:complete